MGEFVEFFSQKERDKRLSKQFRKAKATIKRREMKKTIAKARPFGQTKKKKQSKTLSRKTRISLIYAKFF